MSVGSAAYVIGYFPIDDFLALFKYQKAPPMEYPHWMTMASAGLVMVGLIGLASRRNGRALKTK
jgi:hypothetical protein